MRMRRQFNVCLVAAWVVITFLLFNLYLAPDFREAWENFGVAHPPSNSDIATQYPVEKDTSTNDVTEQQPILQEDSSSS